MKEYILHIETSTKTCSVALGKERTLVDFIDDSPEQFTHAERLAISIRDIIKRNSLSNSSLKAVAVSKGPGSYTGLRIGVSTAKGLCYALNIPLIAIDSLTILTYFFLQENNVKQNAVLKPMIDARRQEVYTASFSIDQKMISPINNEIIDVEKYYTTENEIWFGDGANKFSKIQNSNVTVIENFNTSAKGMILLAEDKFEKNDFENVAYFEPFYLKDFITGK